MLNEEDKLAADLTEQNVTNTGNGNDVVTNTPPPPAPENKGTQGNTSVEPNGQTTFHKDFWANATTKKTTTVDENTANDDTPAGNTPTGTEPAPGNTPKVSKQAVNAGARAAVASINLAQLTICRPLLNYRFKKESQKRFGEKLERAMEMVMGDDRPQNPEEKSLKSRFDRWIAQRDQKVKELPFTDEEEQDMEYAFKTYFETTNKTMSPEVILVTTLVSTIGKRAIDVALWD